MHFRSVCVRVCVQCHEACIAIYSSMQNQNLLHWVIISVLSMFFCLLVYTLTGELTCQSSVFVLAHLTLTSSSHSGVFGFLTFGRDVASDILLSYPGNDVAMIISRLLFGISIVTIYPIILLLGRCDDVRAEWSRLCVSPCEQNCVFVTGLSS